MATVSFPSDGASQIELQLSQFDADEYVAMATAGVFESQRRAELIGGYVVEMSPAGPDHNYVVMRFPRIFASMMSQFELWIQGTLLVDRRHVFDPDFMLLNPREQGYKESLPVPKDVLLLVEVSGSSLGRDAQVKMPIYAAAEIPEYWIADLDREVLTVHRQPVNGAFRDTREYDIDASVTPIATPSLSVRVYDIFR